MRIIILTLTLLISNVAFGSPLGQERDWEFMQSVGGIAISEPKHLDGKWELPVRCDVTGLREITVKPTTINSALVWADTEVRVDGQVIYITIETSVFGITGKSSACGPAQLGKIKDGQYKVMYLSPDKRKNQLGTVKIGL